MTNPLLYYARALFCALALLLVAAASHGATPNLTPSVSGPVAATVGTPFSYTLAVSNIGTGASKGSMAVTDVLPSTLGINSVSTSIQFACGITAQTVTCSSKSSIGAEMADIAVATINVTPTVAGAIENAISVSGGGDSSPADNTTWPITTTVAAAIPAAEAAPATVPVPALSPAMLAMLGALLALGAARVMGTRRRA